MIKEEYIVMQHGRGFNITFDRPEGYESFRNLVDYTLIFDGYTRGAICIGNLSDGRYYIEDVCALEHGNHSNKQQAITYVSDNVDELVDVLMTDYDYDIGFINSKFDELWERLGY